MSIPVKLPGTGQDHVVQGMAIKHLEVLKSARQRNRVQQVLINEVICNLVSDMTEEDFKELHLGDESVIMWALLRASKGDKIEFKSECPYCEHEDHYSVDLLEMPVKQRPQEEVEGFTFEFGGRTYHWHLPVVGEKLLAAEEAKAASEAAKGAYDFEMTFNLAMYIDEVSGITEGLQTQKEKRKAVAKHLLETSISFPEEFMAEIEEKNFGVDTAITITCTNCRKIVETEVPIIESFFVSGKKKRKVKNSLI